MATRSLAAIAFFFRRCRNREKSATYLPSQYHGAGGYFVFRLFYDARDVMLAVKNSNTPADVDSNRKDLGPDRKQAKQELARRVLYRRKERSEATKVCFKYLIRKYPDAENTLRKYPNIGGMPRYRLSIVHQAAQLSHSADDTDILLVLMKAWESRATPFPKQDLIHYFQNSPLDRFRGSEGSRLLQYGHGITMRNLAPSMAWRHTLKIYIVLFCSILASLFFNWFTSVLNAWDMTGWKDTARPAVSGFLLYITLFACVIFSRFCHHLIKVDVIYVFQLKQELNALSLLVLGYVAAPLLIAVGLALRALIVMWLMKYRSGYLVISYVF